MYIDPVTEYKNLSNWINPLIGQSIEPRLFARRLSRFLNTTHTLRLKLISQTDLLDEDDFTIGAEYDPELDLLGKKQLIINLFINHPKSIPWLITGDIAERFVMELVEALVHEYQHQHQYRSRRYRIQKEFFISEHVDPTVRDEQEYLGNPDEIDAYSTNIAARLFLYEQMLNITIDEQLWSTNSLDLRNYIKAFGADHDIVKKLLSNIKVNIQYLKDINNGKTRRKTNVRPRLRRSI